MTDLKAATPSAGIFMTFGNTPMSSWVTSFAAAYFIIYTFTYFSCWFLVSNFPFLLLPPISVSLSLCSLLWPSTPLVPLPTSCSHSFTSDYLLLPAASFHFLPLALFHLLPTACFFFFSCCLLPAPSYCFLSFFCFLLHSIYFLPLVTYSFLLLPFIFCYSLPPIYFLPPVTYSLLILSFPTSCSHPSTAWCLLLTPS